MLYITVQIPLSFYSTGFHVFKIMTIPHNLHDQDDHVTQIEGLPYAVAISDSENLYYSMTEAELLNIGTHHYSDIVRVFSFVNDHSCIMSLYKGYKLKVDKACKYAIALNSLAEDVKQIDIHSCL